ncbi:MAG TPA: DHA2 family efflux MFS transporter permease subunit [Aromatoleum sp.]|uniref:DHA2 family efflux MFS transporter permease subunit n=1 Tax=Aromatoleum sp. TaxID=2307007 RepID=UPI002B4683C8|nr:DHA2 family efflux MFS transporter permease subunit [Aromatoleum sp.]HJV27396.1 DHA2 family efflux MFS transporter permease subunit [Aromatoleum sp.]
MSQAPQPLPPLSGGALVLATVALSLATFMNVLDTTIANVSIPTISGDVGVSASQGTWVITSFAVANAISVPLTGWLTQRIGQVKLFVSSIVLFVIASLLCGMSTSLEMLIAARVLQGAVAGPMIPLSQALLLQSYPKAKSGMALAMWSMTTLVAPVLGPILGGWISDNYTWPWIFYINIPVGLGAAWLTWRLMRTRESATRKLPIDGVGLALLVLGVGALQVMLDKGKELDWFASGEVVTLAVVAVVALSFLVVWELTDKHPVVDLTLFKRRNFATGVVSVSLAYGLFFGMVVLMPLWLQQFMGYTATWAGLVTAPIGVLALLMSPVVGRIMPHTDPRLIASFAFVVFAITAFMRSGFNTDADMMAIVIPQLVQGAAMATFFIPLTALTLSGLPPERIPAAAGLSNFFRITAGGMGASISTTMWDDRAAMHHAHLVEHISVFDSATSQTLQGMSALGLDPAQAMGMIERQVTRQAYMLSATDLFWGAGILFLALTAVIWLSRPVTGKTDASSAGGAH